MAVAKQLEAARVEPEVTELVNGTGHGSRRDPPARGSLQVRVYQESERFKRGYCFTKTLPRALPPRHCIGGSTQGYLWAAGYLPAGRENK